MQNSKKATALAKAMRHYDVVLDIMTYFLTFFYINLYVIFDVMTRFPYCFDAVTYVFMSWRNQS